MDQVVIIIIGSLLSFAVMLLPLKWALSLVVATTFQPMLIGGLDLNTILLVILMLRIIRFESERQLLLSSRFLRTYGIFLAWVLLSLLWAENRSFSFEVAKSSIRILLAMAVAVAIINEESDLIGVVWGIVAGIVYVTMNLLLSEFGVQTLAMTVGETDRLTIEGASVNALATQVAWGVTLVIYYLLKLQHQRQARDMTVVGILLVLCWATALMTGSRTAMLCLIVGPLTVLLSSRPRVIFALLGITAAYWTFSLVSDAPGVSRPLVVNLPLATTDTNARIESLLAGEDDTGRTQIWQVGLLIGLDQPVIGVGAGNAKEFYRRYSHRVWADPYSSVKRTLHNSFVTVFAEYGIVGLVLFLNFLRVCLGIQQNHSHHLGLVLAFGAMLFITGMTSNFEQTTLLMFLLACVHQIMQIAAIPQFDSDSSTVYGDMWFANEKSRYWY